MLYHKHLIVRANVGKPPQDTTYIEGWLRNLVANLNMKILMGPYVVYSEMVGNRGLTGVCIIETSHIALHAWDEEHPSMLQLDVYSCSEVDPDMVFEAMEEFDIISLDYKFLDRKDEFIKVIEKTS